MIYLIIALLMLSGCDQPPTSLAKPVNDGRTEWTKEGKAKIVAEHAEMERLHEKFLSAEAVECAPGGTKNCFPDPRGPQWIVVITQCGTGINNHIHGGFWPYSSAMPFPTKEKAKEYMNRWCEPAGCQLIYGVEQ